MVGARVGFDAQRELRNKNKVSSLRDGDRLGILELWDLEPLGLVICAV